MFKKYSFIDIAFFIFLFIFTGLGIYEFIKFIIPHYSFLKALIVLIVAVALYVGMKLNFSVLRFKRLYRSFWGSEKGKAVKNHVNTIKKYSSHIVYISFIIVSSIILLGMLLDTGELLPWVLGVFTVIFILMKLFGFKIENKLERSDITSANTLRFFLLSFALFFIIMKLICDSFDISGNERTMIYFMFSFAYLVGGAVLFFRFTISFSGLLRPYNILSMLLIFILVGLLGYNNGLSDIIKEKFTKQELIVEEMNLPGIISNEVMIAEDIEGDSKEVEYEQVLVADIYDIETGLALGSVGENVSNLQTVLGNLQYFIGEVSGDFDEDTRLALTEALIAECEWPDSTRGIFGPQAKECIDSLEISIPKK